MCWTFLLCYRDRYPQCYCAGCKAVIAGDPAPRAVSSFRLAHDARHHGRHAMEGQLPDFMVVSVFCALLGSTLVTCCVVRCTRSRAGNTAGRACSQLQLRSSPCCCSQSLRMVGPSLPLLLSLPRALRRQFSLLPGCLRRDVVLWWIFHS